MNGDGVGEGGKAFWHQDVFWWGSALNFPLTKSSATWLVVSHMALVFHVI